jgi:hypothetical protein
MSFFLFLLTAAIIMLALAARAATNTILWGVLADAGATVLMDSGVQLSIPFQNPAGTDSVLCTATDAGATNPAYGGVCLLGSNDGLNFLQLGCSNEFLGATNTQGFDPSTSAVLYYQLALDAGGAVAGSVTCTINNEGTQP